jgi:hypothetical protein
MPGRLLFCTACAARVEVHEPQGEYIDPERYVCGDCQLAADTKRREGAAPAAAAARRLPAREPGIGA